jgi:hypothetical protein
MIDRAAAGVSEHMLSPSAWPGLAQQFQNKPSEN